MSDIHKLNDWYNQIEPGIRKQVRLLRDHGFNTTCSCEHDMTIQVDIHNGEEIQPIWYLLSNAGYRGFKIEASVSVPPDGFPTARAEIYFNEWRP